MNATGASSRCRDLLDEARCDYHATLQAYLRALWEFLIDRRGTAQRPNTEPGGATQRSVPVAAAPPPFLPARRRPLAAATVPRRRAVLEVSSLVLGGARPPAPKQRARPGQFVGSPLLGVAASAAGGHRPDSNPEADAVAAVHQSVSLLIVQLARERALLRFCLAALRYAAARGAAQRSAAALHWRRSALCRVFAKWSLAVVHRRERRMEIITLWRHHCDARRTGRERRREYLCGLRGRRAAREAVERRRGAALLRRWQARRTSRFQLRCMCAAADAFREQREAHLPPAGVRRGFPYGAPPRDVAAHCLQHWRRRTELVLAGRLAAWAQGVRLFRMTWRRLKQRFAAVVHAAGDSRGRGVPTQGRPTRRVAAVPAPLPPPPAWHAGLVNQHKCAAVLQLRVLGAVRDGFDRWRGRWQRRQADRWYIVVTRRAVLQRWLSALVRRQQRATTAWHCLAHWRQRSGQRAAGRVANAAHCRLTAQRVFEGWRQRLADRTLARRLLLHHSFEQWKCWAFRRTAARARDVASVQEAFVRWGHRVALRRQLRALTVLADSIHDTVRLLYCFQRWRRGQQIAARVRLKTSILQDIRKDHLQAACFYRWRAKVLRRSARTRSPSSGAPST